MSAATKGVTLSDVLAVIVVSLVLSFFLSTCLPLNAKDDVLATTLRPST